MASLQRLMKDFNACTAYKIERISYLKSKLLKQISNHLKTIQCGFYGFQRHPKQMRFLASKKD